jgi:hypothetical protein
MKQIIASFLVVGVLLGFNASAADKKIVLVAGTPSHAPGDHEFNAGVQLLHECL